MKLSYPPLRLAVATALLISGAASYASSHREAPLVTEMPKIDGTDFYVFRSYEPGRQDYVTLIANYVPLQDAYGGPNYFTLDPQALYEIHVDNNGDANEDITFQFQVSNRLSDTQLNVGGKQVSIPLIQSGQIGAGNTSNLNVNEAFKLTVVRGNRRSGSASAVVNAISGARWFTKPVDNIGNKTLPDYDSYAANYIHPMRIPGCNGTGRVFVGQRKDPFAVNLGEIFDLINTNPLGAADAERDDLAAKNVTSFILEVPTSCLTAGGETVIGAWTSASLRQSRLLRTAPSFNQPTKEWGTWVQVSRLGMPLVNEVIIGLKDKDRFNASLPRNDAQFADYVTHPTLPALLEILFPGAAAPTLFPRSDLVAAFLTGINTPATGNLNQPAGVVPAEMLRLNTSVAVTAKTAQHNLGVIGGDLAGFPNGRRPGDDIVDIALRVAMGKLIAAGLYATPEQAPAGNAPLTDGVSIDASRFSEQFPYLTSPVAGAPN
jgi:hypothetical protein